MRGGGGERDACEANCEAQRSVAKRSEAKLRAKKNFFANAQNHNR